MSQALTALPLRGPGRFGLNTSQAVATSDPRWSLELVNAVFDDAGRIASRKGITGLTTTGAHATDTKALHEYVKDKDTTEILSAAGLKLYEGTITLTDVTGTVTTPTANEWQFANFNGKVVGAQQGHAPIVYSGTSFANVTGTGSPPSGNAILSSWGRLWISLENRQGFSWCAVLDDTTWSGVGTGTVTLTNHWPDGVDMVVGLAEWQNRLVVFGERSILVFTGLEDPTTLILQDVLSSGAIGRDAITAVGNELVYLSREGLRSISRAIAYENLPSSVISTNVRDQLVQDIASSADYRLAYSETEGGILAKVGLKYWYFDTKSALESGDLRASQWNGIGWLSATTATDGTIYLGMTGEVGSYSGITDDGTAYLLRYRGTWLEQENGRTQIPKSATVSLVTRVQTSATLVWAYDFLDTLGSDTKTTGMVLLGAEWNEGPPSGTAEWNIGEWSGGGALVKRLKFNLTGSGERLQVGLSIQVVGSVAIEGIDLYQKLGRMAA